MMRNFLKKIAPLRRGILHSTSPYHELLTKACLTLGIIAILSYTADTELEDAFSLFLLVCSLVVGLLWSIAEILLPSLGNRLFPKRTYSKTQFNSTRRTVELNSMILHDLARPMILIPLSLVFFVSISKILESLSVPFATTIAALLLATFSAILAWLKSRNRTKVFTELLLSLWLIAMYVSTRSFFVPILVCSTRALAIRLNDIYGLRALIVQRLKGKIPMPQSQ